VGVLQRFEHRVEELVSGAFARVFPARLQPVEIGAALQRECDAQAAIVARGRTLAPNRFVVALAPDDYERLTGYADLLADELARMVGEHAGEQGYTLLGPVEITFESDPQLATGRLRVHGETVAAVTAGRAGAEPEAAYLVVGGHRYPLGPVVLLGRGEDVDLRIDDPAVSRRHAQIRLDGPMAEIVDLGSTNGLIVDGQRVDRAPLVDGSRITLGATTLIFHRGEASSGAGTTSAHPGQERLARSSRAEQAEVERWAM